MVDPFANWVSIGANIVVIIAFCFAAYTFWKNYSRRRKDEQIKIVMEISKRLFETENNFHNVNQELKTRLYKIYEENEVIPSREDDFNFLKSAVISHFNNWEWFALLVNKEEIQDENFQEHFKENFMTQCSNILHSFPDLKDDDKKFPEIKTLYKSWDNPK